MTTRPARRAAAIKRLDAEEVRRARVKRDNEEYYQNGTAWHMPRQPFAQGGVKK